MSEELLINVSPMESRVAILNSGVLSELYIERHNKMGLVGNIYVGTVVRVLPGMQAAFVDIGQSRTAFLHVNDMQKAGKNHLNHLLPDNSQSTGIQAGNQQSLSENTQTLNQTKSQYPESSSAKKYILGNAGELSLNHSFPLMDRKLESRTINPINHFLPPQTEISFSAERPESKHLAQNNFTNIGSNQEDKGINTHLFSANQSLDTTQAETDQITSPQDIALASANEFSFSNIESNINQAQNGNKTTGSQTADKKPTFKVLPTVTETLKKEVITDNNSSFESNESSPATIAALHNSANKDQLNTHTQGLFTSTSSSTSQIREPIAVANVLPTVVSESNISNVDKNAVESKKSLIPLSNEGAEQPTDAFTTSKAKRQKNINPEDLIQNRLREGQRVLVQVTKDQLGTKGARLTTNISLPSRYLVYLPSSDNIGISQRIDNQKERDRLRTELASLMKTVNLQGGLIARTAAERISTQKLEEDIYYLLQLWRTIQVRQKSIHSHQSSMLVYQELSLPLRSLRDLVHEQTERVVVDDAKMYDYLRHFAEEFVPMIYPRIVPYHSQQPMFDVYRVEEDLRDALKRRVDLKSGGYLIIDQTEAMTTIDVNTGSYVGGRSLEDTVYKTNLEATHAIARQLRLRNLGGIIILDFIDMQEQEHRDDVLISLQTQLSEDYARTNITQVSELGLVEMTRKRTRESLEQQLCEPCPTCQGKGFIKTAETVCFEIFREIMRCARTYNAPKQFTVVAHASVIDLLLTSEADTVADLEYLLGRVITFEVENLYTQEQYDIVLD